MPGKVRLNFNDREVQKKLRNLLLRNSRTAGRLLAKEVRSTLGRKGVSDPGQAPGRRRGKLRKSVKHVVARSRSTGAITIRVGSSEFYSRFLALGTKNLRKRPFLFPAFKRLSRRMASIVIKG